MIGVLTHGRLGNQMFQYAFGYVAAKKLKTSFFIYKPDSLHYFKLNGQYDPYNNSICNQYIKKKLFKKSTVQFSGLRLKYLKTDLKLWAIKKDLFSWPNMLEGTDPILSGMKDDIVYDGYFQSDQYFKGYESEIKKMFTLKDQVTKDFIQRKGDFLKKKYVAVHLRRTDYLNHGGDELGGYDMTLSVAYYKRCLEKIKDIHEYDVVFVSDDIDFVKKEFGEQPNYYFERNDEITDFQLLLHADQLIIANSTFSWWAAWLNNKTGLKVFAPNYFLGFKVKRFYPAGIKVEAWDWVDVN